MTHAYDNRIYFLKLRPEYKVFNLNVYLFYLVFRCVVFKGVFKTRKSVTMFKDESDVL